MPRPSNASATAVGSSTRSAANMRVREVVVAGGLAGEVAFEGRIERHVQHELHVQDELATEVDGGAGQAVCQQHLHAKERPVAWACRRIDRFEADILMLPVANSSKPSNSAAIHIRVRTTFIQHPSPCDPLRHILT
jgi:hypothetical protein